MNNENENENQKQELTLETVAAYWTHRGFVGKELAIRIAETMSRGEIVDNGNDACKVCEQMAAKKKVGRKRINLDPIKVKRLAAQGLSQKQIARSLGVSWNTLNRNRKRSKSFNEAFEQGVADGLDAVTNSLFEQALDGNTTASIFFLKNRDEARWRDRVETTHFPRS